LSDNRKYWFRAKRSGWGWGLPSSWQGWIVLVGYMLLVFSGITIIDTKVTMAGNLGNLAGYLVYTALLSVIFIFICWRTGEPMP